VTVSIRVAPLSPRDTTPTVDELLGRADLAMYTVKRRGKSGVLLHTPGLTEDTAQDGLAKELAHALAANQVHVHYQPIIAPSTGRIDAVEALARWTLDGTPVSPDVFIPVAESAGLLDQVFLTVLEDGLSRLASWSPHLRLAVNVSPHQLTAELVLQVKAALAKHAVEPKRLVLELTETEGLHNAARIRKACEQLRRHGVRLSVDDFGTGSSTLARLRDLPVDEVKIDRSFVAGIADDERSQRFVRAVLAFADELDLVVVAEGVEQPAQREALAELGCHLVQGFLFSTAVPPARIDALHGTHQIPQQSGAPDTEQVTLTR
jgi:EAL domain-containing protein (putative c-di-GMP-specific phosphodiesterase class I)